MQSSPRVPGEERAGEGMQDRTVFPATRTPLAAHVQGLGQERRLPCALKEKDMWGEERPVCPRAQPLAATGEVMGTRVPRIRECSLGFQEPGSNLSPLVPRSLDANSPGKAVLLKSELVILFLS